ncbi:enoyl-CoA hydratase/isomerase family protein [Aeromicrobium sp. UC242_57]|uniref:enoyl-CoA hydratase/isomerase family protein n=1 Tax=Aeromicrobium sp. UC242_57 TaxID=3374624 RepID=UPI0037A0C92B
MTGVEGTIASIVRRHRDGDVLVLTIDNPPVNASSAQVRQGLLDGIAELDRDPQLIGMVVIGDHGTFIAGSDLREFGGTLPAPLLPVVIAAIESSPKPVVAAIDGHALGGGFELTLGCDARIFTDRARVGLPEVSLGMVPGAGGTQRLPRLTGRARALKLIVASTRLTAREAAEVGIADAVVEPDDLLSVATSWARTGANGCCLIFHSLHLMTSSRPWRCSSPPSRRPGLRWPNRCVSCGERGLLRQPSCSGTSGRSSTGCDWGPRRPLFGTCSSPSERRARELSNGEWPSHD